MPRNKSKLLNDLSTTDLKRLLAARERIDVLEGEKARLVRELARIESELAKLMSGASGGTRRLSGGKKTAKKKAAKKKSATKKVTGKKAAKKATTRKKATKKKTAKKKVAKKKTVKKNAAVKKTVKKAVARKTAGKSAAKKTASGNASGRSKMKLEDVIVAVIEKNGAPIAFQELKARIVKGRLFKTKSGNFDNVLRRTLSTSKMVKRVGRGIYGVG